MAKHKKVYGFTIAVKELKETVPNIFRYASAYMRTQHVKAKSLWQMFISRPEEDPSFLPAKDPRYNLMQEKQRMRGPGEYPFIDNETMEGEVYNRCHFWSNFEIARLDFFRSPEYEAFFQTMDRSGGFFSERVSHLTSSRRSLIIDVNAVGRRAHPLAGGRHPSGALTSPLLPRHWLPTFNDTTLPRKHARTTDSAGSVLRRVD